jgi:hypothetical protein
VDAYQNTIVLVVLKGGKSLHCTNSAITKVSPVGRSLGEMLLQSIAKRRRRYFSQRASVSQAMGHRPSPEDDRNSIFNMLNIEAGILLHELIDPWNVL